MVDIAASHRGRIGCSEVAAALGVSPWKTALELWLEKTGRAESADLTGMLRIDLGNRLEQVVADLYMERFGVKVVRDNREYLHHELPLVGHIDRRVIGRRAGLEIKTSLGRFVSGDDWGEEGTDQIPLHYLVQVIGYLLLTGYESWDVAVLLAGPEFRVYTVKPDPEAFDGVRAGIQRFWSHVETDMPPPVINLADAARRWPLSTENRAVALVEQVYAARELRDLRASIRDLEALADQRELAIKKYMENSDLLVDTDGKKLCSWKTEHRKTLDTARLKSERPDVAAQYTRETQSRTFRLAKETTK
jgi:putative phage-type endonuclease